MSDAIWEAYAKANKKKKKKQTKKVSNSYGDVVNKQNQEKQAKGRQEAKRKKEAPKKMQQDVHRAIQKSNKVSATGTTVKTDTYTNKKPESYKEYRDRINKTKTQYEYRAARALADQDRATADRMARERAGARARRGYITNANDERDLANKLREDYTEAFKQYRQSAQGKQSIRDYAVYLRHQDEDKDAVNLKSEQLTRDEFNAMVTAQTAFGGAQGAKDLGTKYLTRRGQELGTKGDLAEKVGTRTAYSAAKSKFATGVMQGMSYNDVLFSGAGKYNEEAQKAIKDVQESKAYNAGYGLGQMAQFATSGTAGLTEAGLKIGAKAGAKQLAKSAAKKYAGKAVKAAAVEAPINALDAVKMSRDETGKTNAKEAAIWMGVNTVLSGGTEALMAAGGKKLLGRKIKQYEQLIEDSKNAPLSKDEMAKFRKLDNEISSAAQDTSKVGAKEASEVLEKNADDITGIRQIVEENNIISKSQQEQSLKANAKARKKMAEAFGEDSAQVRALDDRRAILENAHVIDDDVIESAKLVRKRTEQLNKLSDKTGVEYRLVSDDEFRKTVDANTDYKTKDDEFYHGVKINNKENGKTEILINSESPNAFHSIVGHETTHLLEDSAEYETLAKLVKDFATNKKTAEGVSEYDRMVKAIEDSYENADATLKNGRTVRDSEVTAELLGRYLFGDNADDFIKRLTEDRNVFQKVYDYVQDLVKTAKGDGEIKQLKKLEKSFKKAFDDAGFNTEGAQFSKDKFIKQLDAWDGKTVDFSFTIGKTPAVLREIGLKNQQIRMDATKIQTALKEHKTLSINTIKQIPDLLEDPIIVAQSKSIDSRILLAGELYSSTNKPVTVVLELRPYSRRHRALDITKVVSIEGRSHLNSILPEDKILYINPDVKKTTNWLNVNGVQFPLRSTNYGLIKRISYEGDTVKLRDLENTKVTEPEFSKTRKQEDNKALKQIAEEKKAETNYNEVWSGEGELIDKPDDYYTETERKLASGDVAGEGAYSGEIEINNAHTERTKAQANATKAAKEYGENSPEAKAAQQEVKKAQKQVENATNEARAKARETGEPIKTPSEEEAYFAYLEQEAKKQGEKELSTEQKVESHKTVKQKKNVPEPATATKNVINTIRRLFESSLLPFEQVAKQTKSKKLAAQVNRTQRHGNIASSFITTNRIDVNGNKTGKSLVNIYKDVTDAKIPVDDFEIYCLMKHDIGRRAAGTEGIFADMSVSELKTASKAMEEKYGDALIGSQKELVEYSRDLLKYEVDTGVENAKFAEKLIDIYPDYVPTRRVSVSKNKQTGVWDYVEDDRMIVSTVNGRYKIKGSGGGEVENLFDQLVRRTNHTIKQCETNQLVKQWAKDLGIDAKALRNDIDVEAMLNLPIPYAEKGEMRVKYFVDGHAYSVPVNRQVYMGLREFSGVEKAGFINAMGKLAKYNTAFKNVVTNYNLLFGLRNGVRDFQQAIVNSKNGKDYFAAMPAALRASADKNNAYAKLYEQLGGKYGTLVSSNKDIQGYKQFEKSLGNTAKKPFKTVLDGIENINGTIETIPRMSEFIATVKKDVDGQLKAKPLSKKEFQEGLAKDLGITFEAGGGEIKSIKDMRKALEDVYEAAKNDTLKNNGMRFLDKDMRFDAGAFTDAVEDAMAEQVSKRAGKDVLDQAMFNASDITLNFNRSGVIGKGLNLGFVPYFNPSVQGLSKTMRMMSDDGIKGFMNFVLKLGAFTAAPAVLNEYLLKDDEYYQSLNTRDKDNNFFIPLGEGKFVKVPKPRENAVLAEFAEYPYRWFFQTAQYGGPDAEWTDFFTNKEGGLWQMGKSAIDNIGVVNPLTNNLFSPIERIARNKTWYGGDIMSASDLEAIANGADKSTIYDEKTSAVAIYLGKHSPVAGLLTPKQIDNAMDSYLGVIYDLGIGQTSAQQSIQRSWAYNPLVSAFITDAIYSNKYAGTEWDKYNKGVRENNTKTYKSGMLGNKYLYDASDSTKMVKAVYEDDSLSKAEKKATIEDIKRNQWKLYRHSFNEEGYTKALDPMNAIVKHVGVDKAYTKYAPDKLKDQYKKYKEGDYYKGLPKDKRENAQKDFHNYSKDIRELNKATGEDANWWGWTEIELFNQTKHSKITQAIADVNSKGHEKGYQYEVDVVKEYLGAGANIDEYKKTHGIKVKAFYDSDQYKNGEIKYPSDLDKPLTAVALGAKKCKDTAYLIEDTWLKVLDRKNDARCVGEKYKISAKECCAFAAKHNLKLEDCESGKTKPEDFVKWINKDYPDAEKEMKAAWFNLYFPDEENPFGAVGDYNKKSDIDGLGDSVGNGSGKGKGGHGGRGYGGRGYGGYKGGSGNGKGKGNSSGTGSKTTGYEFKEMKVSAFNKHDNTHKSVLTEAYRKRKRKEFQASMKK